ncbi:glycosyltransferase family 39 protein [Rhodobacteraceae bacterium NNCM2]|nr:glycosyltransferase family 39 protein [Coraliihabitans acroporae]
MRVTQYIIGITTLFGLIAHMLYLFQPYFLDETPILNNHFEMLNGKFLPSHAKYPSFFSYVTFPGLAGQVYLHKLILGSEGIKEALDHLVYLDLESLVFPGRLTSLAFLVATSVVSFFTLKRIDGTVGIICGLWLLATPALLSYGSYALPEMLVLLLSTLCMAFLFRALDASTPGKALLSFLLATAWAGLAISSKYNALILLPPVAVTGVLLGVEEGRIRPIRILSLCILAITTCITAFLIGSPGWVFKFYFFLDELLFEVAHADVGHLGQFGVPYLGQFELLLRQMPVVFVFSVGGAIVWALRSRSRLGLVALSLMVSGLVVCAQSNKQSLHYLFPIIPGMLFFSAYALGDLLARYRDVTKMAALTFTLLLASISLLESRVHLFPNTTAMTAEWLAENVSSSEVIALDWAYVPGFRSGDEFDALEARGTDPAVLAVLRDAQPTMLIERHEQAPEYLANPAPDFIVVSEAAFARFFEFGVFTGLRPPAGGPLSARFENARAFYDQLFNGDDWKLAFEADTGNGPRTLVFARTAPF